MYLVGLLDLLDHLRDHFLLCHCRLLVLADRDARGGSREQLTRARPGSDDEFERVVQLGTVNHANVLTIISAGARIRCSRARVAMTMLRNRSTAPVSSSLTTTNSYSEKAATSSRATV